MTDAPATDHWQEYAADRRRIVAMLRDVAGLDGRMKARKSRRVKNEIIRETGQRALDASIQTNDGRYVPHRRPGPASGLTLPGAQRLDTFTADALGESETYFNRRAGNVEWCGRCAVGVGLKADSERVFRARCQDRLCPSCQATLHAHMAAAVTRLLREKLEAGERVFFWTTTLAHKPQDSLQAILRDFRTSWARFVRRKAVKDTWAERLRVVEIEYTKTNGWHPHAHGLCTLPAGVTREAVPALDVHQTMKREWKSCTGKLGRRSHQVDFRELVPHQRCSETGAITHVRYWLQPEQHARALRNEKAGRWTLWRNGAQLYRVQPLAAVVSELTKYVTKRHGDGQKTNQLPLYQWTPQMLHEYALAVRGWNLRRASAGWAQLLQDYEEEDALQRESEDKAGHDYYPWAEIAETCKLAADHQLTRQEADHFAVTYPRILKALDTAGCDISAGQIRGYIFRFFGDTDAGLQNLQVSPYQRRERHEEKQAARLDSEGWQGLRARHFRVLLRLANSPGRGRRMDRVPRLGMSRKRHSEVLTELQQALLVRVVQDEVGKEVCELTATGQVVLSAMSSRKLASDRPKPEARKQRSLFHAGSVHAEVSGQVQPEPRSRPPGPGAVFQAGAQGGSAAE